MQAFCTFVALATWSCVAACGGEPKASARPEQVDYESGPWLNGDLGHTVLSIAQIVITHRASEPQGSLPRVEPRPRSKEEALKRAWQLYRTLSEQPEQFTAVAQRESDEPQSAAFGGALGVLRASAVPPPILNALARLKPGEVSRVVETEQGYHLVRAQPVPSDSQISVSHIVIKTEESVGWRRSDRPVPSRNRVAARALALEVAKAAAAAPSRFAELVRTHSDADDAARDGDMGEWSRHEDCEGECLLFEAASRLPIGSVSGVIETNSGFHILQRTPLRERTLLAASAIAIVHDGAQVQRFLMRPIRSSTKAEQMARQLVAELREHPAQFRERQIEYCEIGECTKPQVFREGRGMVAIERALAHLTPNEIGAVPLDAPLGWIVLRREEATARAPEPALHFRLPLTEAEAQAQAQASSKPQKPDLSPDELARDLTLFSQFAREHMQLRAERASEIERVFSELAAIALDPDADFDVQMANAEQQLQSFLDADEFQELVRHQRRWFGAKGH